MKIANQQARPSWARKYLSYAAFSADEFRSLLCGIDPEDAPLRPADPEGMKAHNDAWVARELRRLEADRHIRDAAMIGELTLLAPVGAHVVAKVREALSAEEIDSLGRAIAHEAACSKTYRVSRENAIRWASARRELFPEFPFSPDDLPEQPVADNVDPRERTTLLTIIATIAELANLDLSTPSKTAGQIEVEANSRGLHLKARTIETHLNRTREIQGNYPVCRSNRAGRVASRRS